MAVSISKGIVINSHMTVLYLIILIFILCTNIPRAMMYQDEQGGQCVEYFEDRAARMSPTLRSAIYRIRLYAAHFNIYKLKCCSGYEEIRRSLTSVTCKPVCRIPCYRGDCVRPNTCQCKIGYYLKSQFECAPMCHPSCKNGNCAGVDDCVCNPGFNFVNGSKSDCEPYCDQGCINADCQSPGVCKCREGFSMMEGSSRVCEPTCTHQCVNAACAMPGICQCWIGYEKSTDNSCRPVCRDGCGPGFCSSPGVCSCPEGYKAVESSTNSTQCEPVCSPGCKNGFCDSPQRCKCYEGYRLEKGSNNLCKPVCTQTCDNGFCVAPDICHCLDGYIQSSVNVCKPLCPEGCGPGTCASPNMCLCPEGYTSDPGYSCKPLCFGNCDNGFCVAPQVCTCSAGYVLDEFGKCTITCDKSCINAICSIDNTCLCKSGFTNISDSECVPECNPRCINGECILPDTCSCSPGCNLHPEESSVCLPQLGQQLKLESTSFLNIYHFPSILTTLQDNETYTLTRFPIISISKSCSLLLQAQNSSDSEINLNGTYSLPCRILESLTESQEKMLCEWSSLIFDNDSFSLTNTSISQENLPNNKWLSIHKNLSIYITFPEEFGISDSGHCSCYLRPTNESSFITTNEDIRFSLSCNSNMEQDRWLTDETEVNVKWLVFLSVTCLSVAIIAIGVCATITIKRKKNAIWESHEDEDAVL